MIILYHGTTKENAQLILKEGFKEGTFFAKDLSDALGYGGNYVFRVRFENEPSHWEYVCNEHIGVNKILSLRYYNSKELFYNKDLGKKIYLDFLKNINNEDINPCPKCLNQNHYSLKNAEKNITICEICGGKGII